MSTMHQNKEKVKAKTTIQGGQDFHTSTLRCCADCGLCLDVVFCTPCQLARISAALNEQPDTPNWGCCVCLTIGLALGGWHFVAGGYTCALRMQTREKYNINGNCCFDFLWSYFCWPCVACQVSRQLQYEGFNPGSCCCSVTPVPPRGAHSTSPFAQVMNIVQPGYNQQPQQPPRK